MAPWGITETRYDYTTFSVIGKGTDGKYYRALEMDYVASGQRVWKEYRKVCVSCGESHGAGKFDSKMRCEISQKKYKGKLHKIYWSHLQQVFN